MGNYSKLYGLIAEQLIHSCWVVGVRVCKPVGVCENRWVMGSGGGLAPASSQQSHLQFRGELLINDCRSTETMSLKTLKKVSVCLSIGLKIKHEISAFILMV